MKLPLLIVAGSIAVLTVVANLGVGNSILKYVDLIPGKDLTGHFCIYAALGFSLSLYLKNKLKFRNTAIAIAAAAIVLEEFSQLLFEHRTFSFYDLAASLFGFTFGVWIPWMFSLTYTIRKFFLALMINRAVPVLNLFRKGLPWDTPFVELQKFPLNTWGRETYDFLTERNLTFLPKYEHHDALHVLLGYDTTVVGEARLQAFMVGNQTPTIAGRGLYFLASIMLPEHRNTFARDSKRGKETTTIDWLSVEAALSTTLCDVREDWNIPELTN